MSYPIPSKAVCAAMDAKSTLNIFAAVEAMLGGGTISGENKAATRVISICRQEMRRQLVLLDKAVAQSNKETK